MFEIIGLAISIAVFFFLSAIAGCLYALLAWLIVRARRFRFKLSIVAAALLPPICATYMLLCTIAFSVIVPGESGSLFGDISQPLPNGYSLQALGKMPDFAHIYKGRTMSDGSVPLSECVGSIDVHGPLVIGQYSHPGDTFNPHPNEAYFVFDTRTAQFVDYPSQHAVESAIGAQLRLTPTQFFQSREPEYVRTRATERAILFVPPGVAAISYLLLLFTMRRIDSVA